MKMPIPTDWDGSTFCNYLVKWPNSALWRMILRGLLSNPSLEDFWDANTGDVAQTIEDFQPTLDQNLDQLECTNMNIPIGTVWLFAGGNAPDGWLWCDGNLLNRDDFPDLFAVIGTVFGSSSGTNFKLPDLRGRVAVGLSVGGNAAFDTLGDTGGEMEHTLTSNEMPSHRHTVSQVINGSGSVQLLTQAGSSVISNQTNLTGGGAAHNNMQPYQVLNYIIRYE